MGAWRASRRARWRSHICRPLKFGEPLQVVTFKDTEQHVSAMDRRASELGLKRSDYLRWLISQDLAAAGFAS